MNRLPLLEEALGKERDLLSRLDEGVEDEADDVHRLKALSLTRPATTVSGRRVERLSNEEAELAAAQIRFDQSRAEVKRLEREAEKCHRQTAALGDLDAEFQSLLSQAEARIRRSRGPRRQPTTPLGKPVLVSIRLQLGWITRSPAGTETISSPSTWKRPPFFQPNGRHGAQSFPSSPRSPNTGFSAHSHFMTAIQPRNLQGNHAFAATGLLLVLSVGGCLDSSPGPSGGFLYGFDVRALLDPFVLAPEVPEDVSREVFMSHHDIGGDHCQFQAEKQDRLWVTIWNRTGLAAYHEYSAPGPNESIRFEFRLPADPPYLVWVGAACPWRVGITADTTNGNNLHLQYPSHAWRGLPTFWSVRQDNVSIHVPEYRFQESTEEVVLDGNTFFAWQFWTIRGNARALGANLTIWGPPSSVSGRLLQWESVGFRGSKEVVHAPTGRPGVYEMRVNLANPMPISTMWEVRAELWEFNAEIQDYGFRFPFRTYVA